VKISVIGTGQVGLVWSDALIAQTGIEVSVCDPAPSPRAQDWAATHGLTIAPAVGPWIADADLVLLCIPGAIVPGVTAALLDALAEGATIVDMSTAAAQVKRDGAEAAETAQVGYVDIAITGAVAVHGVRTPLLYSGPTDERLRTALDAVGAPVTYLADSTAGDAVTVKLLRSVLMKGLEALALESIPAAREYGVLDQLFAALGDVDRSPFSTLLQSMVTSHPAHAQRRHAEVLEAVAQLDDIGYPHELTDQVALRYAATVDRIAESGGPAESTFAATVDWLDTAAGRSALVGKGAEA